MKKKAKNNSKKNGKIKSIKSGGCREGRRHKWRRCQEGMKLEWVWGLKSEWGDVERG